MINPISGTRSYGLLALAMAPLQFVDGASIGSANSHTLHKTNVTCASGAPVEVDVVVVGGGYSGLMSGYDLHQAGLKTVVLEAKENIGGRSRSKKLDKGVIELGATWINNSTQPHVFELTERFGLETAPQYLEGETVFQSYDGKILRVPPGSFVNTEDPELAKTEELLMMLIEESANKIDIENVGTFPEDQDITVAEWIEKKKIFKDPYIKASLRALATSLVGREPEELGVQYFLDYIKSGGGLISLGTEDAGGAQYLKVKEGTTAIAHKLAEAQGNDNVLVNHPVKSITQLKDITLVTTKGGQIFRAKKVILAIPTNTYSEIDFSPALPYEKNAVVSKTMPGNYAKIIVSYSEPWWRKAGLLGKFQSQTGPACFGWDTSDPSAEQYSLAAFIAGDIALEWFTLNETEKVDAIIEHYATMFGEENAEKARDVLNVNWAEWSKEEYLWGGPTSSMGPGLLRQYGPSLRESFGNLHFGGGELAFEWKGYLEGAITSGSTAAKQVIKALKKV